VITVFSLFVKIEPAKNIRNKIEFMYYSAKYTVFYSNIRPVVWLFGSSQCRAVNWRDFWRFWNQATIATRS